MFATFTKSKVSQGPNATAFEKYVTKHWKPNDSASVIVFRKLPLYTTEMQTVSVQQIFHFHIQIILFNHVELQNKNVNKYIMIMYMYIFVCRNY
jgi:hypothetical protein